MGRQACLVLLLVCALPVCVHAVFSCQESGFGHDWIVFNDHVTQDQRLYLREVAHRLQQMERGLTMDFVTAGFDEGRDPSVLGVGDPVSVKTQTGEGRVVWTRWESVHDVPPNDPTNIPSRYVISHVYPSGKYDVEDIVGFTDGVEEFSYDQFELGDDVVYHQNIGQCMELAMEMSIGFHSDAALPENRFMSMNGFSEDSGYVRALGCNKPVQYPIHDMYARALAMILCTRYSQRGMRPYQLLSSGSDAMGKIFTGIHRATGVPANRAWQCSGPQTYEQLMNPNPTSGATCWKFVMDYRDLACIWSSPALLGSHDSTKELNYLMNGRGSIISHGDIVLPRVISPVLFAPGTTRDPIPTEEQGIMTQDVTVSRLAVPVLVDEVFARRTHPPAILQLADASVAGQRCSAHFGAEFVYDFTASYEQIQLMDQNVNAIRGQNGIFSLMQSRELSANVPGVSLSGAKNLLKPLFVSERDPLADTEYQTAATVGISGATALAPRDTWSGPDAARSPFCTGNGACAEMPPRSPQSSSGVGGGFSASSKISGQMSAAFSTYLVVKSFHGLAYSKGVLDASVEWLDEKFRLLGLQDGIITYPLHLLSGTLEAGMFVVSHAIYRVAVMFDACSPLDGVDKCVCEVVEPMVKAVDELMTLRPDHRGENKAITVSYAKSASAQASAAGVAASAGIFITIGWARAGGDGTTIPGFWFEIGGFGNTGWSVRLGTDVVKASASVSSKFAVFFGTAHESSAYSKGVAFGVDFGAELSVSVDVSFRKEYIDVNMDTRCAPLSYGFDESTAQGYAAAMSSRMIIWPVNPVCIRGFGISVQIGGGSGFTLGLANVYTSHGVGKKVTAYMWNAQDGHQSPLLRDTYDLLNSAFQGPVEEVDPTLIVSPRTEPPLLTPRTEALVRSTADGSLSGPLTPLSPVVMDGSRVMVAPGTGDDVWQEGVPAMPPANIFTEADLVSGLRAPPSSPKSPRGMIGGFEEQLDLLNSDLDAIQRARSNKSHQHEHTQSAMERKHHHHVRRA